MGKILVPLGILLKPGKVTPDEFEEIKKHTIYSSILIKCFLFYSTDKDEEETKKYAESVIKTALYHHRALTGGYSAVLSVENITIESEIVRISDIFQALMSQRVYKEEFDIDVIWGILENLKGSFKFPEVLSTFLKFRETFYTVIMERKGMSPPFELV